MSPLANAILAQLQRDGPATLFQVSSRHEVSIDAAVDALAELKQHEFVNLDRDTKPWLWCAGMVSR